MSYLTIKCALIMYINNNISRINTLIQHKIDIKQKHILTTTYIEQNIIKIIQHTVR